MIETIKTLILSGEFLEAYQYIASIKYEALRELLFSISNLSISDEEKSICSYSFVTFLLLKHETVQYHRLAAEIIMHNFHSMRGNRQIGLFHTRRAIELNPEDIDLQEMLLFFHDLPDKLISDEEAKIVATRVLVRKQNSIPSQRVLFGDKEVLERLEKERNNSKNE